MKKPFLSLISLLIFIATADAQNLVTNGDFEQHSGCPGSYGQINLAIGWINPATSSGGSPDYYNSCATNPDYSTPGNFTGYQQPYSGAAYSAIVLHHHIVTFREYIETMLTNPLVAGSCYHFEMRVNLTNLSQYASDDIQVYFSDTLISGINNSMALPYTPDIYNTTGNITDTLNWTLISGNYTASGGENYLLIGNFKDFANSSDTLAYSQAGYTGCYVLIDDVSLTVCTGIEEQNENEAIKIYPNPVKDEFKVSGLKFNPDSYRDGEKTEIIITDVLGKEFYRGQFLTSDFRVPTSNFKSGIYFLEINDGKNSFRKKFLKE